MQVTGRQLFRTTGRLHRYGQTLTAVTYQTAGYGSIRLRINSKTKQTTLQRSRISFACTPTRPNSRSAWPWSPRGST
ncbi:hypothetical protein DPMN_050303 [Dreissena polymorpha]|uniref:Uncharacterized protein n=1 Tax=Dreissena polymorpha TaxID=45954 RepID=A0A9D4CGY4_DREPO|nr:hypothetical protein DPMN_050303 [Dreissena polymorpha]